MTESKKSDQFAKNDRKEIFGWMMYDWANSAFYTTVIAVLLGPYLNALLNKMLVKRSSFRSGIFCLR